ncbi:unnamed protein product [Amaranthus hypochondriacus]
MGDPMSDPIMLLRNIDIQIQTQALEWARTSDGDFNTVFEQKKFELFCLSLPDKAEIVEGLFSIDPREVAMNVPKVTEEEKGEICRICLAEFNVGDDVTKTICNHKLHGLCLWTWLYDHKDCPCCRHLLM